MQTTTTDITTDNTRSYRRVFLWLPRAGLALLCMAFLLVPSCSALYNFDGFPLKTISQGQVNGQVLQYTIMGLQNSPRTLEFDIPAGSEIQWARTYVGVWGGTPRYTGWVQVVANGRDYGQVKLYGQDDKNPNVWCTGYGVYWTAWDTTGAVQNGHNIITATTSQGLPESKLDGRIYGVTTVLVTKTPGGPDVRYWILEGNTNLHGTGWSGDASATVNDETSAQITVPDVTGSPHANLTTIEMTSTKALPDYIQFNGQDLGLPAAQMAGYPAGVTDIADETSMNAGYYSPVKSRYWDIEIFDVTNQLRQGSNEVSFLRGRDLNGDGTISSTGDKPEGEDYLHPVFAMLTLERASSPSSAVTLPASGAATATGTDLSIGRLDVTDAYSGENATITATLQNLGARPATPVTIAFSVDGEIIGKQQVTVDASGIQQVTTGWQASAGSHTVEAAVQVSGDSDTSNNLLQKTITVGSLPDLEVSVDAPHRPGAAEPTQKSPLPVEIGISAAVLSLAAYRALHRQPPQGKNSNMRIISVLFILMLVTAALPAVIPATRAADTTSLYLLPVNVRNSGGSDAPAFDVTIYLDGEKIATKTYNDGLGAGKEISAEIPIHATPGSHTLKIIVDEAAKVKDGNRNNNVAESAYVFP